MALHLGGLDLVATVREAVLGQEELAPIEEAAQVRGVDLDRLQEPPVVRRDVDPLHLALSEGAELFLVEGDAAQVASLLAQNHGDLSYGEEAASSAPRAYPRWTPDDLGVSARLDGLFAVLGVEGGHRGDGQRVVAHLLDLIVLGKRAPGAELELEAVGGGDEEHCGTPCCGTRPVVISCKGSILQDCPAGVEATSRAVSTLRPTGSALGRGRLFGDRLGGRDVFGDQTRLHVRLRFRHEALLFGEHLPADVLAELRGHLLDVPDRQEASGPRLFGARRGGRGRRSRAGRRAGLDGSGLFARLLGLRRPDRLHLFGLRLEGLEQRGEAGEHLVLGALHAELLLHLPEGTLLGDLADGGLDLEVADVDAAALLGGGDVDPAPLRGLDLVEPALREPGQGGGLDELEELLGGDVRDVGLGHGDVSSAAVLRFTTG